MNRNSSQVARLLGVNEPLVKRWAHLFEEYLDASASPPKEQAQAFSDTDLLALAYVSEHWESEPDLEAIGIGLNEEEHLEERFYEILYLNSPILQEPPDGLDDTWRHCVLWIGGHGQERFELARNYRHTAETMLELALERGEAENWVCPVLFAYRHALELYLKNLGCIDQRTHSLAACAERVEKRQGARFDSRLKGWIEELEKVDPHPGTTFRYEADGRPRDCLEYWVDLRQFRFAMGKVFQVLDMAVLNTWGKPPPEHGS